MLLAVWNPDSECFESLCKCISGFTDTFYKEIKEHYSLEKETIHKTKPSNYIVSDSLTPDFWFLADQVWEIRGAELTLSPVHLAAAGTLDEEISNGRGLSLRFPRMIRTRPDKLPEEATSVDQLSLMFTSQIKPTNEDDIYEEEDEE